MNMNDYQRQAATTAIYPASVQVLYPTLGLAGEAGEVANKVKKILRDGKLDKEAIGSEIGDCLWYIAAICKDLGLKMEDVAQANLDKLRQRQEKGTLSGSGDTR